MGASYSEPEDAADGTLHHVVGSEYGFRVHRVEQNSPGQVAGLQSIVDYIVVANGVRLDHDDGSFVRMIAESQGKPESAKLLRELSVAMDAVRFASRLKGKVKKESDEAHVDSPRPKATA